MNRWQISRAMMVMRVGMMGMLVARLWAGAAPAAPTAWAGWASVDITPPLGIALGGRGGPQTLADEVLDPLSAQVLFLKDTHGAGCVLVALDVIGLSHDLSERLRTAIVHELGVDYHLVVLHFSHTHSGPYMLRELMAGVGPAPAVEAEYHRTLPSKVISAVRTAAKTVAPVEVEVFWGKSRVAINRRGTNPQGQRGMIPNPDGPIAEKVWAMKLTPTQGGAPALVFSYGCHPVLVYGYAPTAISADFPGVTRQVLGAKLGPKAHVQFLQGLAGNVRPRVVADLAQGRFRTPTPADVQQAGRELAEDVWTALQTKGENVHLNLAAASDRPFLPRDKPPPRAVYERMAQEKNRFRQAVAADWLARYDRGEGFAKGDPWPVGLIRLAQNVWLCYLAGEPCVEWGPKIEQWLAPRPVVVCGYAQEANTYLPTESLLPEGGYEVDSSNYTRLHSPAPLAPGIEAAVRRSLERQLAFIGASPK